MRITNVSGCMKLRVMMAWIPLLLLVLSGCDSTTKEPAFEEAETGTMNGSIMHDGMERTYILYVPASYTPEEAMPLVLNFHGYTSNASEQMGYGDFRPIADTAGFIVVHPQGSLLAGETHWNVGGWTLESTTDDVGFTEALLDSISAVYNIDQTRIYSTGMSNGGYMSFLLACQMSERIAAIASVTGSMTPETFNDCRPGKSMPVMQIHGTSDNVVPYTGAGWTRSIADVLDYWINVNGCDATVVRTDLTDSNMQDGSTVDHHTYGCEAKAAVEHFEVAGGGHTWPGSVPGGAGTNQDINASAEIWTFFSRYGE